MKKLTTVIVLAVIIAGGYFIFFRAEPEKMENLSSASELDPLKLTDEEKKVLSDQGLKPPQGEDQKTKSFLVVRSADDADSIEKDLNDTDTSELDSELSDIDKALGGF